VSRHLAVQGASAAIGSPWSPTELADLATELEVAFSHGLGLHGSADDQGTAGGPAPDRAAQHGDPSGSPPSAPSIVFGVEARPDGMRLHTHAVPTHPLDLLMGFAAPPTWHAIGVASGAWAMALDGRGDRRPSAEVARRHVHLVALVDRAGTSVTLLREHGAEPTVECREGRPSASFGLIDDALRRSLGLPTAPPPRTTHELWALLWLDRIAQLAVAGRLERAPWDLVAQLHPLFDALRETGEAAVIGWARDHLVRAGDLLAIERPWGWFLGPARDGATTTAGMTAEMANWMDDGMYARHLLAGMPPMEPVLRDLGALLPDQVLERLVATLRAWGLEPEANQVDPDETA
jgi:hypothetical protein